MTSFSESPADPREREGLLRVGVVGCGEIAKHHLRFIAETKTARVVGLADQDEARARVLAASHGIVDVFGSLEELLDKSRLDVLHVLTPPAHHFGQAAMAIDREVHVLIEKPLAFSAHDAEELYRRAEAR